MRKTLIDPLKVHEIKQMILLSMKTGVELVAIFICSLIIFICSLIMIMVFFIFLGLMISPDNINTTQPKPQSHDDFWYVFISIFCIFANAMFITSVFLEKKSKLLFLIPAVSLVKIPLFFFAATLPLRMMINYLNISMLIVPFITINSETIKKNFAYYLPILLLFYSINNTSLICIICNTYSAYILNCINNFFNTNSLYNNLVSRFPKAPTTLLMYTIIERLLTMLAIINAVMNSTYTMHLIFLHIKLAVTIVLFCSITLFAYLIKPINTVKDSV